MVGLGGPDQGGKQEKEVNSMKRRYFCYIVLFVSFVFTAAFAEGAELGLEWDANTETNLAGYKVYYNTRGPGAPYDGTGQAEGNSPIDVQNVTEFYFRTMDLKANNYWFVVTAYSVEGFESGYSNEVNTKPPGSPTNLVGGVR